MQIPDGSEEMTASYQVTPEEEGLYTVYAYLYDGRKRIGHETDEIYVINLSSSAAGFPDECTDGETST